MTNFKNSFFSLMGAAAIVSVVNAEVTWMTDFEAAKKKAAEEKKSLLVDFTGSDWCGWCIKLKDEVFKKPEFKADDKFVFVSLDYPRDTSGMSEELLKQNEMLKEYYKIQGFPTILLLDADGKPFAKTGYQAGGPEAYVKHLDELLVIRETRDELLKEAEGIKDLKLAAQKKAEALIEMQGVDLETHYSEELAEVMKNDPDNVDFALIKFKQTIPGLMRAARTDIDGSFKKIDDFMDKYDLKTADEQEFESLKMQLLFLTGDFDAVVAQMEKTIAVDEDSDLGKRIKDIKENKLDELKQQLEGIKAMLNTVKPSTEKNPEDETKEADAQKTEAAETESSEENPE